MLLVCYMAIIYILGKGGGGAVPHVLVPKNTFTDVFDNTRDIFCPQTTQELPKKHDEAGSPEDNDLPTGANCHKSITDTLDTVKGQTLWRLFVPMSNARGILENLSRGMRMANWEMSAPPLPFPHVQKAPPPQEWRAERFVKEPASIGKRTTTTTTATRAGKTIGFMSKKNITERPSRVHFVSTILRRPQHDYDTEKPVPM